MTQKQNLQGPVNWTSITCESFPTKLRPTIFAGTFLEGLELTSGTKTQTKGLAWLVRRPFALDRMLMLDNP